MSLTVQDREWKSAHAVARECGVSRYKLLAAAAAGVIRARHANGVVRYSLPDARAAFVAQEAAV